VQHNFDGRLYKGDVFIQHILFRDLCLGSKLGVVVVLIGAKMWYHYFLYREVVNEVVFRASNSLNRMHVKMNQLICVR
jgi:hypothetical protein